VTKELCDRMIFKLIICSNSRPQPNIKYLWTKTRTHTYGNSSSKRVQQHFINQKSNRNVFAYTIKPLQHNIQSTTKLTRIRTYTFKKFKIIVHSKRELSFNKTKVTHNFNAWLRSTTYGVGNFTALWLSFEWPWEVNTFNM